MYEDFPPERVAKEIRNTIADLNALFKIARNKGIGISIKQTTQYGVAINTEESDLTIEYIRLVKEF